MHVTFVLPEFTFHPSGGPRVVYEYANGLVERGHQATIVFRQDLPRTPRTALRLLRREIRNRVVNRSWRRTLRWYDLDPRVQTMYTPWDAGSTAVAERLPIADVLVSTFWSTYLPIEVAAPEKGAHLQLVQHYEVWAGAKEDVDRVLRAAVPKVVVAPSLEQILLDLGVPAGLISVVPNGLDRTVFRPATPNASRSDSVAFLVSKTNFKRLPVAIDVLDRARGLRPRLTATGFGTGPRPAELPEWVQYQRQPPPQVLAGEILDRSSIFLCTSSHEGWGLPAAEAMACGCALVSTRNGGVENFAVDGQSAILCDVDDVEALTDAIVRLIDDPEERVRLGEGGLAATEEMSWSHSVDGFERAAMSALAR